MKLPELLKPLENKAELKKQGLALFGKLIRTKNVDKLQGESVIPGLKATDEKKLKLQVSMTKFRERQKEMKPTLFKII